MKKLCLLFIAVSFFTVVVKPQSTLGDVASLIIATPNLDSSVALYEKLGFKKIHANNDPSWVQLTDGSLLIMLKKDAIPFMGLIYYAADVKKIVSSLEKDSMDIIIAQKPIEGDGLHEYYCKSPDGFPIILSNNLNRFTQPTGKTLLGMKQDDFNAADKYPNKMLGAFGELAQPVTDINVSIAFWKKLGFKSSGMEKIPYPHAILSDGLMIIGLHQTNHFNYPAVTYFSMHPGISITALKEKGLQPFKEIMGKNNVSLTTWEGQHIFIFSLGM